MTDATVGSHTLPPPDYLPRTDVDPTIGIGLIGCGFISESHLKAYRDAGFTVTALCDLVLERAEARRDEFFPGAVVTTSAEELLARDDVQVVDVATHVDERPELVRQALATGHHVLSQKPLVRDLDEGLDLVQRARDARRILAANQNARWSPHFAATLAMVRRGDIGDVVSADFAVYWPHDQFAADHPIFAAMDDLVVFDFGIHWFDLVAQLLASAGPATRVYAASRRRPGALIEVPTDVEVLIEYPHASATLLFRGASPRHDTGSFRIEGTRGTIRHSGDSLSGTHVIAETDQGDISVELEGTWFPGAFLGTMSELLWAVENGTTPSNDASTAIPGLELVFAAEESLRTGAPVVPGSVRRLPSS